MNQDKKIKEKDVIHIEICKSEYIENAYNLRIGDIKGSIEIINVTKNDLLRHIEDEID